MKTIAATILLGLLVYGCRTYPPEQKRAAPAEAAPSAAAPAPAGARAGPLEIPDPDPAARERMAADSLPPQALAEAERSLGERVRRNPRDPEAWNAWALAAYGEQDYERCLERVERALDLAPGYREARLNRGLCLFSLRRYPDAAADFRAVLRQPVDRGLITDPEIARQAYDRAVAEGRVAVPFAEAIRTGAIPVDRPAIFARWYGRLAEVLARGPGFAREYRAESPHYVVRTDDSEGFAKLVAGYLETALGEYEKLFAPPEHGLGPPKFAVTVFADRRDYVAWLTEVLNDRATPHFSGGSYHPLLKELVLTKGADLDQTLLVVFHEGFHQYLDAIVSGVPSWFGEGLADYFGASRFDLSTPEPGAPHPMRLDSLRAALPTLTLKGLRDVLVATPDEFMATNVRDFDRRARLVGLHYALSWAFANFLARGDDGDHRPLLLAYYRALREGRDAVAAWNEVLAPAMTDEFWRSFMKHAWSLLPPR